MCLMFLVFFSNKRPYSALNKKQISTESKYSLNFPLLIVRCGQFPFGIVEKNPLCEINTDTEDKISVEE
jgi:hypothetical protein